VVSPGRWSRRSHGVMTEVADSMTDAHLYQLLAPELIRFATGLVGREDAADVFANAIVKALASPSWPTVTNHRAFLYRAVLNEARTWTRRRSERTVRETRAATVRIWELPGFHSDVVEAVVRLSVRQRAVIVLTYWADLDPIAVAERLGISEGSVRRHLARARARLREVLHDH